MSDNGASSQDRQWLFQLYLLSIMRVQPVVLEDALIRLRATKKDLRDAKEKMVTLGFGKPGVPARLYREILGTPVSVQPVDNSKVPAVFEGSHSLVFKLPLWEDFEFVVNEHPDGQAWDPSFRRPTSDIHIPPLRSAADLKPWKFVKEEITHRFGTPQRGDAWDCWEELYYLIPPIADEPPQSYFLLFDYNLLQSFEISL
jgi:hypothetical protein